MSRFRPSILLLALAFAGLSACDKVNLLAPTGSTVTLTVNRTSVPIGGTAEAVAVVIEAAGTQPQDGTTVTFSSTFGTMTPQEAVTQGGIARSIFTATGSGTAKIGAFSGAAKATEVEVKAGGAAAATVAMRSTPSTLPQGGGTVTVSAIVRDASGTTLPNAPVAFTTDQGNLGSTTAISNGNGEATTTLTTNRDSVVTATVISGVTGTVTVRIIAAPSVTITAPTGTINAGVAANFTLTPGAATSGTSIQTASVNFGDGTSVVTLGAISGATNLTHVFAQPGSYTVTATVIDSTGQGASSSVSVIVARSAPTVSVSASPTSVTVGGVSVITITASAASGAPPLSSVQATLNGSVIYSGTSGGVVSRQFNNAGTQTIIATATDIAGGSAQASAIITVTARPAIEMTLDARKSDGTDLPGCPSAGAFYPKQCHADLFQQITFTAGFVGTAPTNITGYTWVVDNGAPFTTTNRNMSANFAAAVGSHTVTVTVNTADGATGSQVITIIVP